MKKLFFSLFAALLLSTSNMAAAACAYMNITSSGASLSAGDSQNVYEFSISCLGTVNFKFEDLSGNKPDKCYQPSHRETRRRFVEASFW